VLAGGFRLREATDDGERILLAAAGTMIPLALKAADVLSSDEGVEATVLCLSSPDRLYRDWRRTQMEPICAGRLPGKPSHLESLVLPTERGTPVVTVIDGASHSLAWIGSALRVRAIPLGVDGFGQSGSQPALYAANQLDADAIVTAALAALEP